MQAYVITIDGPSGSGKGSLAVKVADRLGFHILDSGAIYRLAALQALNKQVDITQEQQVLDALSEFNIRLEKGAELTTPYLDEVDVSTQIRDEKTAEAASTIAAFPSIRERLLGIQREFFKPPGLVADGRDMGTVVFPEAKIKIFLHASAEIRAKRRYNQLINMGLSANIADLLNEIEARDERDRNRSESPLVPAQDAIVVDSSIMDREKVCNLIMDHINEVNNR